MEERFDVAIVGAGPAGLSAALLLGRTQRRVALFDKGAPRNGSSHALHCFLTRDGVAPEEFRQIARDEVGRYPSVRRFDVEVSRIRPSGGAFELETQQGLYHARKLLLATGIVDVLPELPGVGTLFGAGVFHCPYCDGWEMRGGPLAAMGKGASARALALELLLWSREVTLVTHGPGELSVRDRELLAAQRIAVCEKPIVRLEAEAGRLRRIHFSDGTSMTCTALFLQSAQRQRSALVAQLGLASDEKRLRADHAGRTSLRGVYSAGDSSLGPALAIVAAAEGATAAIAINDELLDEDFHATE